MSPTAPAVPVIGLSGALGAGKTTVLNSVLRRPGARVGVIVNDFGEVNVDAGLITGQIDDVAAISGGCICCLPDTGGLDDALSVLSAPARRLDAIIVEASGVADPLSLAHLLRFSGAEHVRFGGIVEVVDACALSAPRDDLAHRLRAASLVVANKLDRLPPRERRAALARMRAAVQAMPTRPDVVGAKHGRVPSQLLFDVAHGAPRADELDFPALFDAPADTHAHAASAWGAAPHPVDGGSLLDLLESPPPHAYRIKGAVAVRTSRGERRYIVNTVGRSIHIAADRRAQTPPLGLTIIGHELDSARVENRLLAALRPAETATGSDGMRRLRRHLRLSR